MISRTLVHVALASSFAMVSSAALSVTSDGSYSGLYVFGDSLVDAGNISIFTGGARPNESLGYFDGRFTNGFNYPDLLSASLFGTVTTPSIAGGNNYAFGGARVVNHGDAVPDLQAQLNFYAAAAGGAGDPDALYILNFGGNDIFGLLSGATGGLTATAYADAVVSTYAGGVQFLDGLGARNILITGIPNATEPVAYQLDARLQSALDSLVLGADTTLLRYSYLDFFARLQANPAALGLPPLDTTTSCLQARTPGPGIDCTGIFSFDGTHPTAAVQAALARDINDQFGIVPEPATWVMLIGGFGLVGAALRSRRREQGRAAA